MDKEKFQKEINEIRTKRALIQDKIKNMSINTSQEQKIGNQLNIEDCELLKMEINMETSIWTELHYEKMRKKLEQINIDLEKSYQDLDKIRTLWNKDLKNSELKEKYNQSTMKLRELKLTQEMLELKLKPQKERDAWIDNIINYLKEKNENIL